MPDPPQLRIGCLASGRGSSFDAIARAVASGAIPGALAVVISDRVEAPTLSLARAHGIESLAIYPEAVRLYAEGRISLDGRRVHIRETA